jgi:hypothetical protein
MIDTFEPPKYLAGLIAAINDGAKAAQTGAFAFGLASRPQHSPASFGPRWKTPDLQARQRQRPW